MKRISIILVILLLLSGCEQITSKNEDALSYKNGKCVVFYPDNNETIKAYAEGLCTSKDKQIIDYDIEEAGDFYKVIYDEIYFYTEKDYAEPVLNIIDSEAFSNLLRYQMRQSGQDIAYTSQFFLDTDPDVIDLTNIEISVDDQINISYLPYAYQFSIPLSYSKTFLGKDFGIDQIEYVKQIYIDPDRPMVALTYDDGPYQKVEKQIYEIMRKYDAYCTFFYVGNRVGLSALDHMQEGIEMGFEFGSHTENHEDLSKMSAYDALYTVKENIDYVQNKIDYQMKIYRPPYGARNYEMEEICDLITVLWNVDSLDWKNRDADTTYDNIISKVSANDVILMHSLYESTAQATEKLVPALMDEGYQLVTVSQLMHYLNIDSKVFAGK